MESMCTAQVTSAVWFSTALSRLACLTPQVGTERFKLSDTLFRIALFTWALRLSLSDTRAATRCTCAGWTGAACKHGTEQIRERQTAVAQQRVTACNCAGCCISCIELSAANY